MSVKITYVFANGLEVKGTLEQLNTAATKFGEKIDFRKIPMDKIPAGYYPSETRGLIKVSEMNDYHVRRALVKRANDYLNEMYSPTDTNSIFLTKFLGVMHDGMVVDLFNDLKRRG